MVHCTLHVLWSVVHCVDCDVLYVLWSVMYCMLYVLWSVLHCVDCDVLHVVVCIVECVTLCGLCYIACGL